MSKGIILIVDDDVYLSGTIKRSLEKEGYDTFFATSGEAAFDVLKTTNIDLILMDIELGEGMNGIDCARQILKKYKIPLIFLSSHTDTMYVERAGEISSYGYVVKDNGTCVLIASVKMAFRLYSAYKKLQIQEEEIREKERIMALSQKILSLGNYTADIKAGTWWGSSVLDEIYGINSNFEKTFENWFQLIAEESREQVKKMFLESISQNKKFDMVYKVIRPNDKKECWVHSVGDFDQSDGNQMVGTLLDITQRKNFEKALSESEARYRTLLNASPEGIMVMDLNGKITDVSTIAMELFEKSNMEELVGSAFFDFISNDEIARFRELMKATLAEGLVQNIEFRLNRNKLIQFPGEISTTLIQEKNGSPKAFMAIIRDISERKRIEQKLIHSERLISLGEMAAGIAHEINQPLNNISLSLENVLYMLNSEDINKKYIINKSKNIFEGISRIENIIDYIRAYTRKQDDIVVARFDLNSSIRFATLLINEQLSQKAIELVLDLHPKPIIIKGNTYKFEQVILNLLMNAKDAIEEKSQKMKSRFEKIIKIKSWQSNSRFFTIISDTGIGIKNENMEKISLPFYTTKDMGKGTGLGLPMSCKIIGEMKGEVKFESEYLKGTQVTISLPVSPE